MTNQHLEHDAKWQHHVAVFLWVVVGVVFAVFIFLAVAGTHGIFDTHQDDHQAAPAWPASWP